MNMGIDYDNNIDMNNTRNRILGVASEDNSEMNPTPKRRSYSKAARKGSGQDNVVSTHPLK